MSWTEAQKELSDQGAKTAFQLAWNICKQIGKKTWEKVQIERAMSRYAENYVHRHGQIKVLGMNEPISLQTIYTDVRLISPHYRRSYESVEQLERHFRDKGLRRFHGQHMERHSGIDLVNKKSFINILGAPGAGKSTFLRRMGLEALLPRPSWENVYFKDVSGSFRWSAFLHECLPVFIELRRFKNDPISLPSIIQEEFAICDFPNSAEFVNGALENGKLLILLDGLDEVSSDKLDEVIHHIQDFADKYKDNRYITSCRTAFYNTYLQKFTDVELAEFDDEQIVQFANNWFTAEVDRRNKTAKIFLEQLFESQNIPILELARTPLLLTFLCLTFDDTQRFPANRTSLYRRAIYILMEKWAAEKRVHNVPIYRDLHIELETEMLAQIAADAFEQDKLFFSEHELLSRISDFLSNTLNISKTLDSRAILEAIEIQQGLLVERATDVFSFSHLTIQEYLTAFYYHSPMRVARLVENHLFDEKWREVFLLIAGMASADDLLMIMSNHLLSYLDSHAVARNYVLWAETVTRQGKTPLESAVRRVFTLSLPLRFKRYEYGQELRIHNTAEELITSLSPEHSELLALPERLTLSRVRPVVNRLENLAYYDFDFSALKNKMSQITPKKPLSSMLPGSRQTHQRALAHELLRGLCLDDTLLELTKSKSIPLQNYLQVCKLIVDCKSAALRVSNSTWDTICHSLVTYGKKRNI